MLFSTVRLVDGSTKFEGRVEIYHNNSWGAVCNHGWDVNDAHVVCNQLGFGRAIAVTQSVLNEEDRTKIWLSHLNCAGNESTVENCSHPGWGYNSYCYYGASVRCSSSKYRSLCILTSGDLFSCKQ